MDLTLNGEPVSVDVRPGMSLLELLREGLGVTSVKDGCAPEGSCGACTVLMDGKAVVSCAQKAERAARPEHRDAGGPARGRARALGRLLRRERRVAVRLLLAGHPHEGGGVPRQALRSLARGDRALPGREPVSLHRLREGRRRDRADGRSPAWRARARARALGSGRRARGSVPRPRAGARRQAVRERPAARRVAARRAPLLRASAREGPLGRHLAGRGAPGRGRRPHARRTCPASACRGSSRGTGGSSWRSARSSTTSATCSRSSSPSRDTPHARPPDSSRSDTRCSSR